MSSLLRHLIFSCKNGRFLGPVQAVQVQRRESLAPDNTSR